jgi:hypothetical protein
MNKPANATLAAIVALTAAACGSGGDTWTGTVVDSAGVAIIENPDQGTWSPSAAWRLEETLRIGETEGNPEYQFGQVGMIGVGSDGSMYVIDAQAQQVRVFSPDGEFLRTIGRPGAGPGEIGANAAFVLVGAGDTIFVPDLTNRRINRYTPDGTPVSSVPIEIEKGLPMVFRATPSGKIVVQIRSLSLPDRPAPDTLDRIVRLKSDGSVGDTLLQFPSGGTLNLGGATPEINLYAPEPAWDVTDDLHIVYGVNDVYRIGFYGADGVLQRVITKPFEREPVSQNDRDAIMNAITRAWTDAGVPPSLLPQLRSFVHFGEYIPAFASLQVGPRGTLWVQHLKTAAGLTPEQLEQFNPQEDLGAPDWDVFDADGRFLGVVTMPERFQPRLFKGDVIYGVWRNELDVQFVTRFSVLGVPGAEG